MTTENKIDKTKSMFSDFRIWHIGAIVAPVLMGIGAWSNLHDVGSVNQIHLEQTTQTLKEVAVSVKAVEEKVQTIIISAEVKHTLAEKTAEKVDELGHDFRTYQLLDERREVENALVNQDFRRVATMAHTHRNPSSSNAQ